MAIHKKWSEREKGCGCEKGEQQQRDTRGAMSEESQRTSQQRDEEDDQKSQECSATAHENH